MNLNFEGGEFRNILSFGNKKVKISFNEGLNLITGNNGAGKSSALLDTLSFCLFGQPYRKIKIDDLINRRNKKNLEVTFIITINENTYSITRGLKPKLLEIKKNGIAIKLLSTKGLVQDEIDKILGINYKTFKQIISLSINHNEPFLKLGTPKKREIIEQIFSIDIFSGMSKIVKDEIKELKPKIEISDKSLLMLKQSIDLDGARIKQLEHTENRFEYDKRIEIADVDNQINVIKNKLVDIKENGQILSKQTEIQIEDNRNELHKKLDETNAEIAEHKVGVRNTNDTIEFISSHDTCPTCNHKISDDYKNSQIHSLTSVKMNHDVVVVVLDEKVKRIHEDIEEIEKTVHKILIKKNQLSSLRSKAVDLQDMICEFEHRKELIQNRQFDFDISHEKDELEKKVNTHSCEVQENNQLKDDMRYRKLVVSALSDTGIKSFVFEEMIPILNYNINEHLKLFELSVTISFDKFMNENIKVLGSTTENVSYYCFSEGEKKRIDMSILLSFIAIRKSLANWNCNLLAIDELLDSSIDEIGLAKLIESMKKMITDTNHLAIYIISHRLKKEYFSQFETLLEVSKNGNGFSTINHLKE